MRRARCERCAFRAPAGADYRCDFCAITGRTRLAAPPEKCRDFLEGKRIDRSQVKMGPLGEAVSGEQKKRGGGPKPKYDWERGRRLYDQGKNDGEIGRELGCAPHTVCQWRRKLGLRANAAPGGTTIQKGEEHMKDETKAYLTNMLEQDLECRRADLDRVILQGGDGKRELERYREAMLAKDDFSSGAR